MNLADPGSRIVSTVCTWFAVVLVHDPVEDAVPPGAGRHLEQQDHTLPEGPEVVDLVQGAPQLHVHEETHPEDCKDEHDEEQEQADVEQGGDGHGEGEQEGPDAPGPLDEPEDPTDLGHPDHPEQGRGDEVLLDKVTQ